MKEDTNFINKLNKQILKLWNEGDFSVLNELYMPDFVRHEPFEGGIDGREAMGQHVAKMRHMYPDLKITVDEKIYDGQTYVSRWRFQGTDLGESEHRPVPPTGKKVDFNGVTIYHLKEEKLVDEFVYYDLLEMFQQLGLIPETA